VNRREFITLLGGAAASLPHAARAQQTGQVRRIGVLMGQAESDPEGQARVAAFRLGLKELRWTEGNNIRIDIRWGAGDATRIKAIVAELVNLTSRSNKAAHLAQSAPPHSATISASSAVAPSPLA
jgi:putative tryptophan/tyrosine transport system substrate-binding protein